MPPSRLGGRSQVERWLLLAILIVLLCIGLVLADDYGSSWDEKVNFRTGRDALGTFVSPQRYLSYLHNGGETLAHHGPSYFMAYWLVSRALQAAIPSWDLAAARHFTNYLTFLLAIGCMYALASRLMPKRSAWAVPALFATQPLLFGHAFINQKDMPFLAFFLACVTAGIAFVDWLRAAEEGARSRGADETIRLARAGMDEWRRASRASKSLAVAFLLVLIVFFVDAFWGGQLLRYLHSVVAAAYAGQAWGPLTAAFQRAATDAYKTPLAAYQFKVTWAFWMARVAILVLLVGAGIWLGRKALPNTARLIALRHRRAIQLIFLLGMLLGFTIAIRPIGAFAGVLVLVYWLLRLRWRNMGLMLPYWGAASVTTYIAWPYLWQDPLGGIWRSAGYSADFGSLVVLYRGNHILSDALPWDYFPTLSVLQLTIPASILFVVGLPLVARSLLKGVSSSQVLIVLLIWLVIPLAALLFLGGGIYGGIRQMLFLLAPIVAIAGIGLGAVLQRIRADPARIAFVSLVVLPGILEIWNLHPYEYAYFNELVGGAGGAAGKYELDFWCTSLRESMEYVNERAEPEDVVVAWGPYWAAEEFARPDLKIRPRSTIPAAYILTCSLGLESPPQTEEYTRLFDVQRDSAVLGSVFIRKVE